ncbi:pyruvate, phosphate dikinase [Anaplasma marginale]|uniref:Pyruvate, phosphate dikinase n=1 Tax=Anaplasma marginale (strain Florida) TaxID=320483 RepID=B9KHR7_ANAMF|nr:pyruvate, phosphate dikinase [Anaplasma marginale]ACM49029.1 pyruvate, phosphate dikinase precursor (ppdK) [Anaplasma marginale str. Florida]KAB0452124.1 pyruvate, phosphate dikinase [Anaplasma marginale]RCL19614.1 pyruvate, phosphate dikinase [Anaplasma marginale]TZF77738.1 pyruvate, phosphate dikinase [Anaplasma marginale]
MSELLIYHFSKSKCDGGSHLANLLGNKGAGLAEMCRIGINVPPGFTIPTSVCGHYHKHGKLPEGLFQQLQKALQHLGNEISLEFGNPDRPLLVSVRSGSVRSMPGMMDTILNVGINDEIVEGLKRAYSERFAYDSYRRLIQMYATTVMQLDNHLFEEGYDRKCRELSLLPGGPIADVSALSELVTEFKHLVLKHGGAEFPQNVHEQLYNAIGAVFRSWMNSRAVAYRKVYGISSEIGTAVNVQSMVFGNVSQNSATGVVFTRNPSTGAKEIFGEFLINAQGEDVVSGNKDPAPISLMERVMPRVYGELVEVCHKLEQSYKDMQDVEFTVQDGKLWILQTRAGKRSAQAAVHLAVAMVKEGLISREEAINRIDHTTLSGLLHPVLDGGSDNAVVCRGLPASPGAASGCVAFTSSDAESLKKQGKNVILVRQETSPEDIGGMSSSAGILTLRGGMTSHAAVVARGMGKPCICGTSGLFIDKSGEFFYNGEGLKVAQGENITINGSTGEVMLGTVKTVTPQLPESFSELMSWVDEVRTIGVMANADTPEDMKTAKQFGADGVGLCRTEHMFFSDGRIATVQEMIVAGDKQERDNALAKIEIMQKNDFKEMFACMQGKQITIRLLDPPLHEFLPTSREVLEDIAKRIGKPLEHVRNRVSALSEKNPMLGHRGCRLAISYPEIYEMQVRAIFQAVGELREEGIAEVVPEIMVPFVMDEGEITRVGDLVRRVAEQFNNAPYSIGVMIELPRAALLADRLAKHVQFFSFGTNDLTQTTLGMSRDDSSKFVEHYTSAGILRSDPFELLDEQGVGKLIEITMKLARESGAKIKTGMCGEHGGTLEAMQLCAKLGIDYVSCSPYKVPVAKLLAAKCAIACKQLTLSNGAVTQSS